MSPRLRVGVIFGGQSGEHEVSLASARSVMAALDPQKYEIVPIGITRSGRWLLGGDPLASLAAGTGDQPDARPSTGSGADPEPPRVALAAAMPHRELVPGATGQHFPRLDVIFPVLHGPFGEDGTIQGLLDLAGMPYVGCGVLASAVGMDKITTKAIFAAAGLPQPSYLALKRRDWERTPEQIVAQVEAALPYPLFVKPANLGSSIGISKAKDAGELATALTEAARYDRRLLVEEAVPNVREIECSVLGNDDPIASVPGEVVPSNEFYDYAAKYIDGDSALLIPAPLPASLAARVRELSVQAYKAIDAAGLARVDFLLNRLTDELYINEVNTLPGFTTISMYPKLWEATGLSYPALCDRLIELAVERHHDRARSATTLPGTTGHAMPGTTGHAMPGTTGHAMPGTAGHAIAGALNPGRAGA
jgi:D-alanine-D-alanine ligase